ncbi:MAG: hypothetical protein ED559_06750 [Phycisphaera sp.]|nr:MAG: hypothetical protein ED559_06750 [Phycisphaera sp.]
MLNAYHNDARGQRVPIATIGQIRKAGVSPQHLRLPKECASKYTERFESTQHHWTALIAFLGVFPAFLIPVRIAQMKPGLPPYVYLIIFISLVVLFVMVAKLLWRQLFADRFVDTLKRHRYCPSCIYDVSGVPLEQDNCRVCPECGSVWHIPDDMQPKPVKPEMSTRKKRGFFWPLT